VTTRPAARRGLAVLAAAALLTSGCARSVHRTLVLRPQAATRGAVTEQRVQYVDRTRSTVSHRTVLARSRTLPTWLLTPTAPGPHPLVVFAHGYDVTPLTYSHLLHAWANAGFIVAAPYFPLTNPSAGRWLDEADVDHQPTDAAFILTQVERTLGRAVDTRHVFVAGHSDGGSTSFGAGFAHAVRDPRWTAVLIFAGARRPTMGSFSAPARRLPSLLIQSDHDQYNSLLEAARVWAVPRAPKVYVHLHNAPHLAPFSSANPYRDLVEATTVDFLRAWTATTPAARAPWLRRLDRDGTRTQLSTVTDVR
jgi:poly(3-hydroxybutyrate) depolymerase